MKVLIIGLRVGAGLISMCQAVKEKLDLAGCETIYTDLYANNKAQDNLNAEVYYKMAKCFPRIMSFGQNIAYKIALKSKKRHFLLGHEIKSAQKELKFFLEQNKPDVVFTNVQFVAFALDKIIDEGGFQGDYYFQTPDFMGPYYTQTMRHAKCIFSSCEEVTQLLIQKGCAVKIITTGIPVSSSFENLPPAKDLCEKLGLPDTNNILISNGGAGFGSNKKLVENICPYLGNYRLIVINGNNTAEKEKIEKFIMGKKVKNVVNLGFVKNMPEYMAVSGVMLGKCGGSTLSEASSCELCFIAYDNKLFPEIRNIKYLKQKNAAFVVRHAKDAERIIKQFLSDNQPFVEKKKNFSHINLRNAAQRISDIICADYKAKKPC